MLERLLITLILALIGSGAFVTLRYLHIRQINGGSQTAVVDHPTLLYFRSDNCPACPTQARFIEQVAAHWNGRLTIQTIDADKNPEKTAQFKVLTLPTTILLDKTEQVRQVNYGLTNNHKLQQQLLTL